MVTSLPGKIEEPRSFIERAIDSLLARDATEGHLRQMTGDCLSKIEQWRMVRGVRLAFETCVYHDRSFLNLNQLSVSERGSDIHVRSLIVDSALRQLSSAVRPDALYYQLLLRTFHPSEIRKSPAKKRIPSNTITAPSASDSNSIVTTELNQAAVPLPLTTSADLTPAVSLVGDSGSPIVKERHFETCLTVSNISSLNPDTSSVKGFSSSASRPHTREAALPSRVQALRTSDNGPYHPVPASIPRCTSTKYCLCLDHAKRRENTWSPYRSYQYEEYSSPTARSSSAGTSSFYFASSSPE
jgi:hypothetical protein